MKIEKNVQKLVEVGDIVLLSEGEYSDYRVTSCSVCIKQFSMNAVKEEWKQNLSWEDIKSGLDDWEKEYYHDLDHYINNCGIDLFKPWFLTKSGYVEENDNQRWFHLGSYCSLDIS